MHAQSHISVYTVHSMYMYLHLQHVCPQVVCSQVVLVWVPFQRLQTVFNKLSLKMEVKKMFNDPMYVMMIQSNVRKYGRSPYNEEVYKWYPIHMTSVPM